MLNQHPPEKTTWLLSPARAEPRGPLSERTFPFPTVYLEFTWLCRDAPSLRGYLSLLPNVGIK